MLRDATERFPWHRCKPGESFFVPALDPYPVIEAGLMLGSKYCRLSQPPRAKFCIYQGVLGVMFTMPGRAAKDATP